MDQDVARFVARVTGSAVAAADEVQSGFTASDCYVVTLADRTSRFVKVGGDDHSREAVRSEYRLLAALQQPFCPRLDGFHDDPERPTLVLENLSDAKWPPPWAGRQVNRVVSTLHRVASTAPPPDLPTLEDHRMELFGWIRVAEDPGPFLSLMVASAEWLDTALPLLIASADAAVLAGSSLVHFDVRSDNICFQKRRTVLVDWASAAVGNPLADVVGWLPSLALEGGPAPDEMIGEEATELAALVAGYWASKAGLPPPGGRVAIRSLQRAQLGVALAWVARLLGLAAPY